MDFDPTPTILHNQEDVIEYLMKHYGPLPPCIEVIGAPLRQISKSIPLMEVSIFTPDFGVKGATFIDRLCPPSAGPLQCRSYPVDARCVTNDPGLQSPLS